MVAAEHINDLVGVHLRHVLTGHLAILARVEVVGMLGQGLTHTGGGGPAGGGVEEKGLGTVGVDVDLADGALGSLAELLLGDTYGVGQVATVLVDDLHILLRH